MLVVFRISAEILGILDTEFFWDTLYSLLSKKITHKEKPTQTWMIVDKSTRIERGS